MSIAVHAMNTGPGQQPDTAQPAVVLHLLSAIENDQVLSQRSLASRIGIALGLANALIRRCIHKGHIKISEAPTSRYLYYLTPSGFAEKSRLVSEYVETSLGFFRSTRQAYAQIFTRCAACGQPRVLLAGSGELAEVALLAADGTGVTLVGALGTFPTRDHFHSLPVFRDLAEAPPFDVVVLAEANGAQATYDGLAAVLTEERIAAPKMLHVTHGCGGRPL